MSHELCPICFNPEGIDYPLVPIDSHDARHRFHEICIYNFFEYQGSCPICRERVRVLNDPREEPPAHNVNAAAQGFFFQQHPLTKAIRENQPIDDLIDRENMTRWVRDNGIRMAALHGRQAVLETLIETDTQRGAAIPFLIPHHTNLIEPLLQQSEDRNQVIDTALVQAAIAGHQEALDRLIETDQDRILAIGHAAPKYMGLVETLLNNANNPNFVREEAIIEAASNRRASVLNALIHSDRHRGIAIAFTPSDQVNLIRDLLDNGDDPNFVRIEAITNAALNNKAPILNALIQTDKHRSLAAAFASPNHVELVEDLLNSADHKEFVRKDAIIIAALNNREAALNTLIFNDVERALAAAFALPDYPDLVQNLLNSADDKEFVRKDAIITAAMNNRGAALNALNLNDAERATAAAYAAPHHMDLVENLLNSANDKESV